MNIKLIVILVLLAAAGAGGYYFMGVSDPTPNNDATAQPQTDNSPAGDFASLLESGDSMQCDIAYETETDAGTGTFYVANDAESFRADYNLSKSPAGAMSTHIIGRQGFIYTWKGGDTEGMKIPMTGSPKDNVVSSVSGASMDQNMDIDCRAWQVDDSQFTPPSSVSFMEIPTAY